MSRTPDKLPCSVEAVALRIKHATRHLLNQGGQPSPWEFVEHLRRLLGTVPRFAVHHALAELVADRELTHAQRSFLSWLVGSEELQEAFGGVSAPGKLIESSLDELLREAGTYRSSNRFQEMITFMARFRNYSAYNNMLVRAQNPSCSFFATRKDWWDRFRRTLIEDARPMIILAPMHPVLAVYDIDSTEGRPVPKHLLEFARFEGHWDDRCLNRAVENAARHYRIRVDFKRLSTTLAGFATTRRDHDGSYKLRIAVHEGLDMASRFGVLCHELAHILCGHLGGDGDRWWPSRSNLERHAAEVEAEAVAYLVTTRIGLQGSSASYISGHLSGGRVPSAASLDMIAKAAGKVERMALTTLPSREPTAADREPDVPR